MRPQSEITGNKPRQVLKKTPETPGISVRWTNEHHIMYLRLGGSKWLREQIELHLANKKP